MVSGCTSSEPGCTCFSSELLWLTPTWIGHEKGSVVGNESLLQLVLGVLINELLVVSHERLGDCLSDGVDLGGMSTTRYSDANVDGGELVESNDEKWLVHLESQDLWLNQAEWLSVNLDETLSCLEPVSVLHPASNFHCRIVNRWRTLQWATAVAVLFLPASPQSAKHPLSYTHNWVDGIPKH